LDDANADRRRTRWQAVERVATASRWPVIRLSLFVGLTLLLAVDQRRRLGTMVPGDPGDAFLIMSLMEWGGDRSVHFFNHYWDGPMFAGGTDVMAYTDTFLPLVMPFKLIETVTGSRVIAFNALYLSSWVICAESTYHLARRLMTSRGAATVAAVGFTFSTIRLTQSNHFQLAWAGLIPLSLVLLMRLIDRPTPARAVMLAAIVLALVLTSAYYGVLVMVFTITVVVLMAGNDVWRHRLSERLTAYSVFLLTLGLPMLFVRQKYSSAEHGSVARSGYPSGLRLTLGDLRSPSPRSAHVRRLDLLNPDTIVRSSENYAYVGALVIVLIPLLALLVVVRASARRQFVAAARDWVLVACLGAMGTVIAVGRGPLFGIHMPFYDIAVAVIPGLSAIVALVRLFVFGQLLLSLAAAAVVAWVLEQIRRPPLRLVVCGVLVLIVAVESRMWHPMVRVVDPEPGSIFDRLDDLEPGIAVIIPVTPRALGATYAFTESTRMVLGADDSIRTVNGYSGYAPAGYEERGDVINEFPSEQSLDTMRALDVRYVVLPTAPVDTGMQSVSDVVNSSGYAYLERSDVERRIIDLPPGVLVARYDATDGIVIEIA
jgi:hypothetical protein